jgi:hypothetical protein
MSDKQHAPASLAQAPVPTPQRVPAPTPSMGNAALLEDLGLARVQEVAETFIEAATDHQTRTLFELFDEDATFEDPIFGAQDAMGNLGKLATEHEDSGAVITFDPDYRVEPLEDGTYRVELAWEADYELFHSEIHNVVVSTLVVSADGEILSQVDDYDRDAWLAQALPYLPSGGRVWVQEYVLTPFLRHSLPRQGRRLAESYGED